MATNVSLRLLLPERTAPAASKRTWWQRLRREPGVSRSLAAIKQALPAIQIVASGDGLNVCVVLTERELILGCARWFGARVERHRLSLLTRLRVITNRDVDLLELEFSGRPSQVVAVMYAAPARDDFSVLIARLQRRLAAPRPPRRRARSHLRLA